MQTTTDGPSQPSSISAKKVSESISKGTVFGVISSVVQVATRLVIVPTAIQHLGLDGFGIWSTIIAISQHMRFGSIGLKSAFQKYVAESTGNGNFDNASKLLSTGSAAMLVFSLVGLIPAAILSPKIAVMAGVPQNFIEQAAWAISMLALTMVFVNVGAAYEAIITGGHRSDLARKFGTGICVLETAASMLLLHLGFGLVALAITLAASQFLFVACCFLASGKVVPEIEVSIRQLSRKVIRELVRFAGSYQLVGVLQITYNAIIPIIFLRAFGASHVGLVAVSSRLISPVSMCQYAFLLPILSSGAMIYASGSKEKMNALLTKSIRITLMITLLPLSLIAAFGSDFIALWTGQTDPDFAPALVYLCVIALFQAFAVLAAVLYRTSGNASLDNGREAVRLPLLLLIALFSNKLGFFGVLLSLAGTEFLGLVFMLFALRNTFRGFEPSHLLPHALKLIASAGAMVAIGMLAGEAATMVNWQDLRLTALAKSVATGLAILASAYPALTLSGAISRDEIRSVIGTFSRRS